MNEVEEFISKIKIEWQQQKCEELLALQNAISKDIEAAIKWGNPYFSFNGSALLKWYCANNWINVYFFKGYLLKDKTRLFEETDNSKMRTIKIFPDTAFDHEAFKNLVKQAIDLNS